MSAHRWIALPARPSLAALAALAVLATGCFGSGGPVATPRPNVVGSHPPTPTPQLLDPFGWPDDMPRACWLLEPHQLERQLGMEVAEGSNPFVVTSEEVNATVPLKNACQWKEPLFGEWTASELVLVIHTPLESEFITGEWERNEELRLELHDEAEPSLPFITRAWFDPGTSNQPTSITLEDGSRAIGARATLYVEVGQLWLSIQPSGEAAVRSSVVSDTLLLAYEAVAALVGLVS